MTIPPIRAIRPLLAAAVLVAGPAWSARAAPELHAEFLSGAGVQGVREVRMWVDGEEVTANATLTALRASYRPPNKLAPGPHSARVVVVDSMGRSFVHEWTFQ